MIPSQAEVETFLFTALLKYGKEKRTQTLLPKYV